MEQSVQHPPFNPQKTDEMEVLIVNPVIVEIASRLGSFDMDEVH